MTRTAGRAFALAAGFAVVCFLGIGIWATWRRSQLRAPLAADGVADAQAVLAWAAEYEPSLLPRNLGARARLEQLVAERGMVGAIVLAPDGKVLARAGDLPEPVLGAALEDVAAKPASRQVERRLLYREANERLIAIAVEDLAGAEAAWRPVRNRAIALAVVAVALAPAFGYFVSRRLGRARAAGTAH